MRLWAGRVVTLMAALASLAAQPALAGEVGGNIWEAMARERGLAVGGREVERHRRLILGNTADLRGRVERSSQWLAYVFAEVRARGMPAELALLPMIESSYDPRAVSTAKAAGLWQIMPGTARELSLRRSHGGDPRLSTPEATAAALSMLSGLRERFGSWEYALAAYNMGPGGLSAALRKARGGKPRLPAETAAYVPRLAALAGILLDAEARRAAGVPDISSEPRIAVVESRMPISLGLVTELSGVRGEEIRRLNPWASSGNAMAPWRVSIVLPREAARRFEASMASLVESHDGVEVD